MRLINWLIIAVLALGAGCAHYASDEESKIQPGMTPDQVIAKLGEPEHVKRVRFPGHQRDYLVLEYNLVPEIPACPSSAAARAITGMLTLGVSEVGWTNAQATPTGFTSSTTRWFSSQRRWTAKRRAAVPG